MVLGLACVLLDLLVVEDLLATRELRNELPIVFIGEIKHREGDGSGIAHPAIELVVEHVSNQRNIFGQLDRRIGLFHIRGDKELIAIDQIFGA